MVVVKFVNEPYKSESSIKNLINYAINKNNQPIMFGGINVFPPTAVEQFTAVKRWFGKTEGYRQVRHIIVSFDCKQPVSLAEADLIARKICEYYADRYQILYGIHDDTDDLHIHIVLNTTSYVDGLLYSGAKEDFFKFKSHAERVVREVLN